MTPEDFRTELVENVRARAESWQDFVHSSFIEEAAERLSDAEEFADFMPCQFELSSRRRKLRIDGYAYDETDNSLAVLIAEFSNEDVAPVMNASDVTRSLSMLQGFVEEALSGRLTDGSVEESNPACALAEDLIDWHPKVSRYALYLVTDAELRVKARDWPSGEIDGRLAEYHIWDFRRFHAAQESATGRDDLDVSFSEVGEPGLQFLAAPKADENYQAYLCMISGSALAALYDRYGSRLLEGNVRSFLSAKGKVNAKIQQTIRERPGMFFAFNNGIAATAEDVTISETPDGPRIVGARNLQIVNGGQTTASLAFAGRGGSGRKDGTDLSRVVVPVKLSVLPPGKAGALIPDIARYANSQNKVSDADFFSNHPFHVQLEEFSRRMFAPAVGGAQSGTHWFYERARGQYVNEQARLTPAQKKQFQLQNPKAQLLTKTDVAKLQNTWAGLPHKVSLGAQKNFTLFADQVARDWEKDRAGFNEDYFRQTVALAILFRQTENLVTRQTWYQMGYRAQVVTYSLAKLHEMVQNQALGKAINLREIWDRQTTPPQVLAEIEIVAKLVFDILTAADRPKDNVTEWAKQQACWERISKAKITLSPAMAASLIDVKALTKAATAAKSVQALDDGIAAQTKVVGIPGVKWVAMLAWGRERGLLTPAEQDLLKVAGAIPRKMPDARQSKMILSIREKLSQEGFG